MDPLSSLSKRYGIMINDVDFSRRLKLSALSNYFQVAASAHAEMLGLGFNDIRSRGNAVWALIRLKVCILEYPLWNDEIIIDTWPQQPGRLEFERDFIVKSNDGRILARAISIWVIIDAETRQLKKPSDVVLGYPEIIGERALPSRPEKLKPLQNAVEVYKRYIGASDIDMNGHINNSKYMDFVMDCFAIDELKRNEVRQIQINFLNEAFAGDTVTLCKSSDPAVPGKIHIEGLNSNRSIPVFRADLEIAPKGFRA